MQNHLLTANEPVWHSSISMLMTADKPPSFQQALTQTLTYSGSMTQYLTAKTGYPPRVSLLNQGWQLLLHHEAEQLGLSPQDQNKEWTREVLLYNNNRVYMFARSVFPKPTLAGDLGQQILALGDKPLGILLFESRSLTRTPFNYAQLDPTHYEWQKTQQAINGFLKTTQSLPETTSLWGRYSLFTWFDCPILLTEVFLPILFSKE